MNGTLVNIMITAGLIVLPACTGQNEKSDAYGNFEAVETIISAETAGPITEWRLAEGMKTGRGDTAAVIDTTELVLQKQLAEARYSAALARIESAEHRLRAQKKELSTLEKEKARVEKLYRDSAATARQLDEIRGRTAAVKESAAAVRQEKKSVAMEAAALDKQLELAREKLRKCVITNPVPGTVLETFVEEYELVTPGKPLYKTAPLSPIILRVYVSGAQLNRVRLGGEVDVYIDKNRKEKEKLRGTVSWIASNVEFTPKTVQTREERVSQVYAVKIRVKNDGRIKIGMPGEAVFPR